MTTTNPDKARGMAVKPKTAAAGPGYFIIAENRTHAGNVATLEWGWKVSGKGWQDPEGHHVEYCPTARALIGLRGGARVYCAGRWYANVAPHYREEAVKAGHIVVAHPTVRPRS